MTKLKPPKKKVTSKIVKSGHSKNHKKKILLGSFLAHVIGYFTIGFFLKMLGLATHLIYIVIAVMFWGYFVMAYAYYFHR
jgi:hypothetical protein